MLENGSHASSFPPALHLVLEIYTEDILGVVAWSWKLHTLTISKRSKLSMCIVP